MKQSYFRTGSIVFGNFVILGRLGTGGMGVVYKARNNLLDKLVALKVLTKGLSGERDLVRFQNEARILSKLDHTNVARVYDFGYEDGTPYLSMDYAEGPSLQVILDNRKRLELSELIPVFSQICDGLGHAHSKNVIHRDVKPANIILSKDESGTPRVVIVDFGVAKVDDEDAAVLTQTGSFIGSPLYASPEQASGTPVTAQSDMYSLGCMMFQALSGEPPFVGETALQTLIMHRESELPAEKLSALDVPDALRDLILDLLEKDPDSRPSDVSEIKEVLHEVSEHTAAQSGDLGSESGSESDNEINSLFASFSNIKESTKTSRRRGLMMAVGSCVLILLVGIGLILFTMSPDQKAIRISDWMPPEERYEATSLNESKPSSHSSRHASASSRPGTTGSATRLSDGSLSLDLSGASSLGDEEIAKLVRGKKIVELNLQLTGASNLDYLKDLRELRKLNLGGTNIDDDSLDDVAALPHLEELSLRETAITRSGFNKLVNVPSLRKLDPWKCAQLPPGDIAEVIARLRNCELVFDKDLPITSLAVGSRLEAEGKIEEALKQYEYCLAQARSAGHPAWKPVYVGASLGKQSVFLKQGKSAEGNKIIKELLSRKLNDAESTLVSQVLIFPSTLLFEAGKRKEAVDKMKTSIKLFENSANAISQGSAGMYSTMTAWQVSNNQERESIVSANKALAVLEAIKKSNSPLYGAVLIVRGQAKHRLNDNAGARKDLAAGQQVLQKTEMPKQNFNSLLTLEAVMAEIRLQEGNRNLAIAHLKNALVLNRELNNSNKEIEALYSQRIRDLKGN